MGQGQLVVGVRLQVSCQLLGRAQTVEASDRPSQPIGTILLFQKKKKKKVASFPKSQQVITPEEVSDLGERYPGSGCASRNTQSSCSQGAPNAGKLNTRIKTIFQEVN